MAKSILQKDTTKCFYCGSPCFLEKHHCFTAARRNKSEEYGLWVMLCHSCHNERPNGVHMNKSRMAWLQDYAQKKAMKHYGWSKEKFMENFYKNYLIEEEK